MITFTFLLSSMFLLSFGQDCKTNVDCFIDSEECEKDFDYDFNRDRISILRTNEDWEKCQAEASCHNFNQICVKKYGIYSNVPSKYQCLNVSRKCSEAVRNRCCPVHHASDPCEPNFNCFYYSKECGIDPPGYFYDDSLTVMPSIEDLEICQAKASCDKFHQICVEKWDTSHEYVYESYQMNGINGSYESYDYDVNGSYESYELDYVNGSYEEMNHINESYGKSKRMKVYECLNVSIECTEAVIRRCCYVNPESDFTMSPDVRNNGEIITTTEGITDSEYIKETETTTESEPTMELEIAKNWLTDTVYRGPREIENHKSVRIDSASILWLTVVMALLVLTVLLLYKPTKSVVCRLFAGKKKNIDVTII